MDTASTDELIAALAEAERGLQTLRDEMVEAKRHQDWELYTSLANRYGRLHGRWEEIKRRLERFTFGYPPSR